ncbi:MAG: putative aminopeptidase [Betaproteobacteria bacterium]|nr:putative aminopeptidase [Betaproteobacteria bacterium]
MSAWRRTAFACACVLVTSTAGAADLALNVKLDPRTRHLAVTAELASPGNFAFALHSSLSLQSATADGRRVPAAMTPARDGQRTWRIATPKGVKLRIEYSGTLPALETRDHRGVLQGLSPMASAQGAFLPAGSGWYPELSMPFSYLVRLTLPADQRGLVPGRLVSESSSKESYSAQFAFDAPAEGIDLMAGPYVVREKRIERRGAEPLRLRTYFYPDLAPLAEDYLEDSARYIATYSDAIGPYPYDMFSVVASPLPTGFGMPTLTYLGAEVLKLPFIRATSLGHEVLHNWWGNGVRVDYSRGNWSEGLTTFMADYFYKERDSAAAAREMRLGWLRDFAAVPEGRHVPLSAFQSRTHGAEAAVGYGKAAMVFLMLRDVLGTEAFDRGIRAFYAAHRFKDASWDDLRTAFEQSSGRNLRTFFEQWVRRAGGPAIYVTEARVRAEDSLSVTLTQRAPAYVLDVPLELIGAEKSEMRRVPVDRERQEVRMEVRHAPQRVRVDPDLRLWRKLAASELSPILRQWIIAAAPRLAIVSADGAVEKAARDVALAFFESEPQLTTPARMREAAGPVLLVGLHAEVDAALAAIGAPPRPPSLEGRGTAQVWAAAAGDNTPPLLVISARDADALRAVGRALPHLGSQSYLVFDAARVIDRGLWPAAGPVVPVD